MSISDKVLLVLPATGECLSQGALLHEINSAQDFAPMVQPKTVMEAYVAISLAIAHERDLLLFDSDLSVDEIRRLGFASDSFRNRVPLRGDAHFTMESLAKLAAGHSRARFGLFTSGSSGLPRLVWQPLSSLARGLKIGGKHSSAVWASAFSATHIAGVQVILQAMANGCNLVNVFGLNRARTMEALARQRVTHISGTPSFYRLLLPADSPVHDVKSVTLGGESADFALIQRLRSLFPMARFRNIYASTEAGTLLQARDDVFEIPQELKNKICVSGGRICVHRSLIGSFETQGGDDWYDTGDIAEPLESSGTRFRIVGRESESINVGGLKVNPRHVEQVIEEYPGVVRARVFGRPNSVVGNLLYADVVTRPGAFLSEPKLREYLASRLQAFKLPRIVRFVSELGQTRSGKLARL